jgi:two-component system OmpR family sensor kinase
VTAKRRFRAPYSILGHTLLLVIGIVVLLTLLNLAIVLLRPPPRDLPLTAYEVSRLLRGESVAKDSETVRTISSRLPRELERRTAEDALTELAIAHQLGLPAEKVRLHHSWTRRNRFDGGLNQDRRELAAYGIERFDPVIFGRFMAAARGSDGAWRIVSREAGDSILSWQFGTALRIILSLLLVVPIAWLFSRRIARPIRAFARAAGRLGNQHQAEPVEVAGPEEIRLAAAAVNEMQTRISRYVAERTSVVGALAHDLRTPLSRLNFHLAAIPDEVRGKAEAEIAEMEQMIAATLEFVENETRLRPGEKVDLALLVEGVVDDLADLGRDVRIERSAPATVLGDTLLLKRLFSNLINNAVFYGGRATVTLEAGQGKALVEVADEGPGLSAADLERAFEPFYRAETSRNRATGGMGLGLAIVKAAAERHGGAVTLFNRAKGGLCARVTLPTI